MENQFKDQKSHFTEQHLCVLTDPYEIDISTRLINSIAFFNKHMNDTNFEFNVREITPAIINSINPQRKLSPLTFACRSASQGKLYMTKLLLKLGGNPLLGYPHPLIDELLAFRCVNKYKTAQECAQATDSLPYLAATCCYEKIAQIIDHVKQTQPKDIENSLMMFVKYGSLGGKDAVDKTALELMSHGANPNALMHDSQQTQLMRSVAFGILTRNINVMESLLKYGGLPEHAQQTVENIIETIQKKSASDREANLMVEYCFEVMDVIKKYY
ncbi:hypothetical protein Noda2021_09270 [Candidatus Dependentiae bacterium Noda2021]|nr:hypothetical protein Noda2021_09270 [Candidatus Dependentiae bacterium Noda2021]